MGRMWIAAYAVSILIGLGLWYVAPARWDLKPMDALLLGSALYFGALHRFMTHTISRGVVAPWRGRGELLRGLLLRATLFFAIATIQIYSCFVAAPYADVRAGFVVTATWLVAQALIDSPGGTVINTPKGALINTQQRAIENRVRSS